MVAPPPVRVIDAVVIVAGSPPASPIGAWRVVVARGWDAHPEPDCGFGRKGYKCRCGNPQGNSERGAEVPQSNVFRQEPHDRHHYMFMTGDPAYFSYAVSQNFIPFSASGLKDQKLFAAP
jgi:hypothetical protein